MNKVLCATTKEILLDYWDFPKGGVDLTDINTEEAILRELKEETGSVNYKIIRKFDSRLDFDFPSNHKFDSQKTTMYYIEFLGSESELKADGVEISKMSFYSKEAVLEKIKLEETKEFLSKKIW